MTLTGTHGVRMKIASFRRSIVYLPYLRARSGMVLVLPLYLLTVTLAVLNQIWVLEIVRVLKYYKLTVCHLYTLERQKHT
jgi:hypothetical protein